MTTLTIPKQLSKQGDLVLIPKKEYEELLSWKKHVFREVKPTRTELKALARARKERASGNFVTLEELKSELGF